MSENGIAIISLSGGMDSTSLLVHYLARGLEVYCVSFNYGQKHVVELERAADQITFLRQQKFKVHHEIIDLTSALMNVSSALLNKEGDVPEGHYEEEQMKATVVPNRNAIFSSIIYGRALSLAQTTSHRITIGLGVHSGDHAIYPDCRPEFYTALEHAFTIGNWDSELISFDLPYLHGTKSTILLDALDSCQTLGLDFDEVMKRTITSYQPDEEGRSSGKTGSDIERILAFHDIGRMDPIEYIDSWASVLEHALRTHYEFKDQEYRESLTEMEYHVTRNSGTEPPYSGKLLNEHRIGVFRCLCCQHPLFDSSSKYESGCGWPAFHTERDDAHIKRIEDRSHGMLRTEVRCTKCDAHLGHVFNDGPKAYGGERYCINSVSMTFEPEGE